MKNNIIPKLVGVLNITPDSFSDGGLYNSQTKAAEQLEILLEMKADVIDIGAVSTNPRATLISAEEEIERYKQILPSLIPIINNCSAKISIDSPNYATICYLKQHMRIDWVNDQSGFIDDRMISLLVNSDIKLVIMHHLSLPANANNIVDPSLDIVIEVKNWLLKRGKYLQDKGIKQEQIIIDPGIGFGKNAAQSWQLIREANSFKRLGFPVLFGHSRKSFLNDIAAKDFKDRDLETAIISFYLAQQGIDYLRVHDIAANKQALKIQTLL